MDGTLPSISPPDLAHIIGTAAAPIVVDVRSTVDLAVVDRLIPGSIHHPPTDVEHLRKRLPAMRPIVVCDLSGSQASWTVVEALRRLGSDARHLTEGLAAWRDRGLPTRRNIGTPLAKWASRERPQSARIPAPWPSRRFPNPPG